MTAVPRLLRRSLDEDGAARAIRDTTWRVEIDHLLPQASRVRIGPPSLAEAPLFRRGRSSW